MSYIRAGSNPEALYIFGSKEGIEIHWNKGQEFFIADQYSFYKLCERYHNADFMYDESDNQYLKVRA